MRKWEDYKNTMHIEDNLWNAAKANDISLLYLLARPEADIDAKDRRGYSPLMLAVYSGHVEASRFLINKNADPNSADFGGNTILMGAAFKGHTDLVKMLIEAGANANAKNNAGLTALDFAHTFGRHEIREYLQRLTSKKALGRLSGFFKILFSRMRKPKLAH